MRRAKPHNIKRAVVVRVMGFGFGATDQTWPGLNGAALNGIAKRHLSGPTARMICAPFRRDAARGFSSRRQSRAHLIVFTNATNILGAMFANISASACSTLVQVSVAHLRMSIKSVERLDLSALKTCFSRHSQAFRDKG